MTNNKLKRIAIIGLPGSGKSTFALKLAKILNLPVHHLDKHLFDGSTKRDHEAFLAVKHEMLKEDAWIIEGCSIKTLELRFQHADTVLYLRFSRLLCLWRVCKRYLSPQPDSIDNGCLNGINWPLFKYIWNFDKEKGSAIDKLRERYPQVNFIIFKRSSDLTSYLNSLKSDE